MPCSFFVLRKKLVKKQGMKDSRKIWAFTSETWPHARLLIIKVVWLKSLHEETKLLKFWDYLCSMNELQPIFWMLNVDNALTWRAFVHQSCMFNLFQSPLSMHAGTFVFVFTFG